MSKYANVEVKINDPEFYKITKKGATIIISWKGVEVKVPKVLNGHREDHHCTETELKSKKLMPDAPPIGYGLQQFTGDLFYLFDRNKTKKFETSEIEKKALKEYRERLKERKTCPICNKVQKKLDDIASHFTLEYGQFLSCNDCYETRREEMLQKERSIKHDFTSYFINKGIDINVAIDETETYETVYLDFETTGLSSYHDEIIQVSIIDNKERVLFYKLCKPSKTKTWDEAMSIHGITPKDVENELPFETYVKDISNILLRSNTIVCYNCPFEIGFLDKYGVKYSIDNSCRKFKDCMLMFAEIYGEWSEYFEDYKWQKLTTAANYYNYSFDQQEHNSLADVFATKFVYELLIILS